MECSSRSPSLPLPLSLPLPSSSLSLSDGSVFGKSWLRLVLGAVFLPPPSTLCLSIFKAVTGLRDKILSNQILSSSPVLWLPSGLESWLGAAPREWDTRHGWGCPLGLEPLLAHPLCPPPATFTVCPGSCDLATGPRPVAAKARKQHLQECRPGLPPLADHEGVVRSCFKRQKRQGVISAEPAALPAVGWEPGRGQGVCVWALGGTQVAQGPQSCSH